MNPYYLALLGLSLTTSLIAQADNHPNVLYVFPDQMRNHAMQFWNQQPYSGHVRFKADPVFTPNLNKFAAESVVLTSAQSCCPLSSPHRGMLLTGMYPDGSGVTLNCNSMRPASSLREDAVAVSDVFSRNGYRCAYIGKLHVDFPTPNNPQQSGSYVEEQSPVWDAYTPKERRHGFDYWYSYGTYDVHKSPHYWDTDGNRHDVSEWSPKHEADKAIEYLESVRDTEKPFFMMIGMNPPHSPYQSLKDVMEEDYNRYKDTPLNELLLRSNVNPELTERIKCAPYYFAAITGVDREFGRILDTLERLGLAENTIVVFSSDHGDTMGSHVEDPKNSPYAEAMNVPFLIRYPKKLKPHVSDLLLSTPDVMPTLLSLAGLKKEIPAKVQGQDLSAFFTREKTVKKAPQAVLYIRNVPGNKNEKGEVIDYFPAARGVKTQDYTLAITIDKQKRLKEVLLFDDRNDPYQLNNLPYNEHPALFKSLCKELAALLKKADDPWLREKILPEILPY
ncbi:MAG: sulfatase [Prevotella sp.]|jgi:arylsulfatase A-like enzyme|nr:sulfatase [Prevotella sp.]